MPPSTTESCSVVNGCQPPSVRSIPSRHSASNVDSCPPSQSGSGWLPVPLAEALEVVRGPFAAAFHGRADIYGLPGCGGGTAVEMSDQLTEERRRTLWLRAHRMGDMLQYGIPFRTGEDHKGGAFAGATCQRLPFSEL